MRSKQRALIIGGGIGGLAMGIALQRAGWAVDIFEQAAELREVGAGLSLWANAVRALDALGVAEQIRALKPPAPAGGVYTWRGRPLITASAAELERRLGEISVVVHRAELLEILRRQLDGTALHLGKRCTAIEQDALGVMARFADGSVAQGDVLIGADGVRSTVRGQIVGDGEPTYAGYTSWRSIASFDHSRVALGEYWGSGARFGVVPLSGGRVYWFATRNAPPNERGTTTAEQALLLATFRGWCAPIEQIIRATPADTILRHDIADRAPLQHWSVGRITLLGDAAHPMTPNLGQGACQALEDAVVLAACLRDQPDVATALRAYERRRIPRTTRIVLQSRRIGQLGQWSNPFARGLRDLLLRVAAPLQSRAVDQVIGYRVESTA